MQPDNTYSYSALRQLAAYGSQQFSRIEDRNTTMHVKLENVAIANALQLEAARCRAVRIRFNFVARAKLEVAQPAYPLAS